MSSVFLDGLSVLSEKWMVVLGAVSVTCLGFGVGFFLSRDSLEEKINPWRSSWLPAFFFVVSVPLRLAFLKHAFVPPYFDSVEHYRVIKELVTALETSTLLETVPALTPGYYHLGFHFLASLLTLGLHTDPIDVILVLGQVVLARSHSCFLSHPVKPTAMAAFFSAPGRIYTCRLRQLGRPRAGRVFV
jgi:hypothetical protein